MSVLKVKVISLPYIFQVLYVLCFTRVKISGERLQDQWSSGFSMLANELGNPSMDMNGEFIFDKRFGRDFHNGL